MEEKNTIHDVEIEVEQETDYEELLKKFEEPQQEATKKKSHHTLGFSVAIIALVLLVGTLAFLLITPKTNDDEIAAAEALLTSETDSNNVWQAQAETAENGKLKKNGTGALLEYIPEKVKNIKVENTFGSYSLDSYTPKKTTKETDPKTGETTETTSKTEYTLIGYEDFDLESGSPDDLANDCSTLEFTKIISLDATDNLKDYGLDNPRSVTTITYTDGSKAVVKVGADALQGAGTYISFGDSNAVYLVATESVDTMLKDVKDLISLTINDAPSDTDSADFEYVKLTGKAYESEIILKPNKNTDCVASSYLMTSPREFFADDTAASSVSGGIRGLLATDVVCLNPTAKDLKTFGISEKYAYLVAKYSDKTVKLIASQPDKEGNCYLIEDGGNVIYQIASTSICWVNTSVSELESDYVLNPKFSGLKQMSVKTDSDYNFVLATQTTPTTDEEGNTTDTTTTNVYYGTSQITTGHFETYFANVGLLTTANSERTAPKGKADLTITYEYSGKRDNDTIKFFKTTDGKHIVTLNSDVIGQVYSSYVENIIEQTAQISQNKEVKSFW